MPPSTRKRSPAKAQARIASYAEVFRALGDPMRTEIIRRAALMDELPCTHLEQALPVSKSTISYHVKILFQAGLLEVRKEGRFYFYRLREDTMGAILPEFLGQLRETALKDSGVGTESRAKARRKDAA
jgi:ArsR family transcriptional regulator, arsenate/arsenite/antimonite-responsive transcriptional repressor